MCVEIVSKKVVSLGNNQINSKCEDHSFLNEVMCLNEKLFDVMSKLKDLKTVISKPGEYNYKDIFEKKFKGLNDLIWTIPELKMIRDKWCESGVVSREDMMEDLSKLEEKLQLAFSALKENIVRVELNPGAAMTQFKKIAILSQIVTKWDMKYPKESSEKSLLNKYVRIKIRED